MLRSVDLYIHWSPNSEKGLTVTEYFVCLCMKTDLTEFEFGLQSREASRWKPWHRHDAEYQNVIFLAHNSYIYFASK